tara:strand:+ start:221 stop:1045 length:825 start_codon:yes stop_codon:yes gene_type:complete
MIDFETFVSQEAQRLWDGDHLKRSLAKAAKFSNFKDFGTRPIDSFKPHHIHSFFDMLSESGRGNNTINHYAACLAKVFSQATDAEFITHGPKFTWKKIKGNKRPLYYTSEQLLAMEAYFDEYSKHWWIRHLIIIGAETGMRIGEILTLDPSSFSLADSGNTWAFLEKTKNGEERYVPINKRVRKALSDLGDQPSLHWNEHEFYRAWGVMRSRLLHNDDRYVFHTLRHTCATRMANDFKANTAVIGLMLGHKSEATTRKYIKSKPEALQALVDQF